MVFSTTSALLSWCFLPRPRFCRRFLRCFRYTSLIPEKLYFRQQPYLTKPNQSPVNVICLFKWNECIIYPCTSQWHNLHKNTRQSNEVQVNGITYIKIQDSQMKNYVLYVVSLLLKVALIIITHTSSIYCLVRVSKISSSRKQGGWIYVIS